jgi:osmotically-inducible protein OsmY
MEPPLRPSPEQDELTADVARALCETGYSALREVQVTGRAGILVLTGHVPSYFLKQLAQHVALSVPGIQRLDNALEVTNGHSGRR